MACFPDPGRCDFGLAPPTLPTPSAGTSPNPGETHRRAGTPVTEKVFVLLLTALAVQMAFKGRQHECDSPGYGPLRRRYWQAAGIVGFTHFERWR